MNENDEPEEAVRDLDASLLRWTAAVVRQWGDVFDRFNRQTRSMNGRNGTITSCTRSLDLDFHFFDTKLTGRIGNGFGGTLSGKWGALAAAFETYCTRAGPASVTVTSVLLNVDLICTIARLTLRRVLRFLALATFENSWRIDTEWIWKV